MQRRNEQIADRVKSEHVRSGYDIDRIDVLSAMDEATQEADREIAGLRTALRLQTERVAFLENELIAVRGALP